MNESERKTMTETHIHYGDQASGHYRIEVDFDLCKGHAACMSEAPELFHVNEEGRLTVLNDRPGESLVAKANAAAKYCPTQAIRVIADR
jgi:sterol 14-demethylase